MTIIVIGGGSKCIKRFHYEAVDNWKEAELIYVKNVTSNSYDQSCRRMMFFIWIPWQGDIFVSDNIIGSYDSML